MLYLCFPITELEKSQELLGRVAKTKEVALFKIDKNNISVYVKSELGLKFALYLVTHNFNVNVILKNVRSTKAAIYSDGEITTIDGPSHSDISQGTSDYYSTKAYPYQKRLNYSAGNPAVKLFVNNRKVTDDAACKVSAYM